MSKRKAQGIIVFTLAIAAFFVYAYLLMLSEWSPIVLQLTILMVVGGILGVISWIGYMMATTKSSPSSIIQDEEK
jgi:predicted DNA-binding transcriptional regulator